MRQEAERFINYRLEPLLSLANAFSNLLATPLGRVDRAFAELLGAWVDARNNGEPYRDDKYDRVFSVLGFNVALFIVEVRSDLKPASIRRFLERFTTRVFTRIILSRSLRFWQDGNS